MKAIRKILILLSFAIVCFLLLNSCSVLGIYGNSAAGYSRRIINAINEQNSAAIEEMFSSDILETQSEYGVTDLLSAFPKGVKMVGNVVSGSTSESIDDGHYIKEINWYFEVECQDTKQLYCFAFGACVKDTKNSEQEGITHLIINSMEQEEECVEWWNSFENMDDRPTGIYLFGKEKELLKDG